MNTCISRQRVRRPPSLRQARIPYLLFTMAGVSAAMIVAIFPWMTWAPLSWRGFVIVTLSWLFSMGCVRLSVLVVRRRLAAKAPGLCPACEYALEVTNETPPAAPIVCPECGYEDTAGGIVTFWKRVLGAGSF